MNVRVVRDPRHRPRVAVWTQAMLRGARARGLEASMVTTVEPRDDLLVAYGCGRPDMSAAMERQIAAGGRVLHLDAPYWGIGMRLALDGLHPTTLPEAHWRRLREARLRLTDDSSADGHIVLVGLGPKSRHLDRSWEQRHLEVLQRLYPRRSIVYRPKPRRPYQALMGVQTDPHTPIRGLLVNASLVVTRHSNVGVDACLQGIPVCTETGAAAWLYGNDLAAPCRPDHAAREEFLARLAWWNWQDAEAGSRELWNWVLHCIETIPRRAPACGTTATGES